MHDYTSLKNCLKRNEITVIGDSRARQQTQAMKARYYNTLKFQANKSQEIPSLPPNLNYQWSKFLNTTEIILENIPPPRDKEHTIILGSNLLWSLRQDVLLTDEAIINAGKEFQNTFKEKIVPLLIKMSDTGFKFIWMASELCRDFEIREIEGINIKVPSPTKSLIATKNQVMTNLNIFTEKQIKNLKLPGIEFMSSNLATAWNLDGTVSLMEDSLHKMTRTEVTPMPISLLIDTSYLFNKICEN